LDFGIKFVNVCADGSENIPGSNTKTEKPKKYSRNRTRKRTRNRLRRFEKSCTTVAVNPDLLFKLVKTTAA